MSENKEKILAEIWQRIEKVESCGYGKVEVIIAEKRVVQIEIHIKEKIQVN